MDLANVSQLGAVGVALVIIWLMFKSSSEERKHNDERLDRRDEAMRQLERDIRNTLSVQLMENTNALTAFTATMKEVVKELVRIKNP
jgi:hypothetical protein